MRAELAVVLLQSGRYTEAAREFRELLVRNPDSFEYRLGLARALAWGERPREAERELRILAARRPGSGTVDTLLRSVRDGFEPRASEAAEWVTADPVSAPYRLALARALARERMPRLAIAQFDTLLDRPEWGRAPDRGTLLREIVDAYEAAGDRAGAAERVRQALSLAPADSGLRHRLAVLLTADRRYVDAQSQYDSLIAAAPAGRLHLERARVRLALGDARGAEVDLASSLELEPSAGAYLLLGDVYRGRGDYRGAGVMYRAARARRGPTEGHAIASALAQLAREERPAVLAPVVGHDPGWELTEDAAADNAGIAYSALALRRTLLIAPLTGVALGAEYRQLAERTAGRSVDASGYGATFGLSQEVAWAAFLLRAAAEGGVVYHPLAGTLTEGSASVATWVGAWQLGMTLTAAPAYPTLFTTAALLPPGGGAPLTERTTAATLAGPLGGLDVGVSWQRSRISDGNTRLTMQGYARYPLAAHLFALYSGSVVAFAERSSLYWDPKSYVAHGAGLEVALRRTRGLSIAARVLPSFAWSTEAPPLSASPLVGGGATRGALEQRSALQLGGGGEGSYRSDRWEVAGGLSYGRGRAGNYQRLGGSLTVRILP